MVNFTIPVAPRTKKNHAQIIRIGGRPRLIPSKQYIQYEKEAGRHCPALQIDCPINIEAHYYMETRRAVDLNNLSAALLDVLKVAGTIVDDNCKIVVSLDGSRVFYDKEHPRTEVTITEADTDDIKNN